MNIYVKILAYRIQGHTKDILYLDQLSCISEMQAWYDIGNSINTIYQNNKTERYNHMIISLDAEKNHWQNRNPLYVECPVVQGYKAHT